MLCAKEMLSRTNQARGGLLMKKLPSAVSVKRQCFHAVTIFGAASGRTPLSNLRIYGNISKKICAAYSETFSKMTERQKRQEMYKKTVLGYLNKDPRFKPLAPLPEVLVRKNGTEAGISQQPRQKARPPEGNAKQSQYFRRMIMTSLGRRPNDCRVSQQTPLQSPPIQFESCSKNRQDNRVTSYDAPKNALQTFFTDVANKLKSPLFLLSRPEFVENRDTSYSCTYNVIWPKPMYFTKFGNSKKDASHNAAIAVLEWLSQNQHRDPLGKPVFRHSIQSRLKLHDDNANFKQPVRVYSTTSKIDVNANNEHIETVRAQIDIQIKPGDVESIKSLYIAPKNVLHNCFHVLSTELKQKDLKLVPQYKLVKEKTKSFWTCTYNLKWPELVKFSESASTKQEASHKAAVLALAWLKEKKRITKEGQPLLYDRKELSKLTKKMHPVLVLDKHVEQEMKKIVEMYKNSLVAQLVTNVCEQTDAEGDVPEELAEKWPEPEHAGQLQQKFMGLKFYLAREPVELPISKYREDIIEQVKNHRVLIVKGEPGCGKSTRVPQYVLEAWAREGGFYGQPCRIVVTQPRRIAAISLAERVAHEREEIVGRTVGYHVRLNSNFSNRTGRILYCTTGILLRRLQLDPKLSDCSHVILDEAHERDVNTDLLMNLLRHALDLNPNLKVLVMSATIDAKIFQDYFDNAPVLHIPGFTYPVKQHFLKEESELPSKTYQMCMGQFPNVVTEDVVKSILHIHRNKPEGAILCFLPGWEDIMKVKNSLPERNDMAVLCLHSKLQVSEQRKIFSRPPPGVRKVILSTNIAETSVTIDDVVYVIDTGIHKEERFDVEKGVMCIDNHWISQASAIQRKGRAGRCQAGECFRLYPEFKYDQLLQYSIPEILRTSLTKIVLDSKVYSNNMNALEFLELLVCPPEKSAVKKAVEELQELELLDENENLTPLGRTLSDFQLAPKLAKAMVNAVIFKCVTPIVDIATLYSSESTVFSKSLIDKEAIKEVMTSFSSTSDHLAFMGLFETWLNFVENGDFEQADEFCEDTGLVQHKLKTLRKLREIHFEYLNKGLKDVTPLSDDLSDNYELVKAVLLSGVGTVLQHRTWDIVKGRIKKANVFLTKNNLKATITSESVNYRRSNFPSDFLLYINEMISNLRHTTLIRETSQIPTLAVLLFKIGNLEIEDVATDNYSDKIQSSDQVLLKLQGTKIAFLCDRRQAADLKALKEVLRVCMQYYIYQLTKGGDRNPKVDVHWDEILKSLNAIFVSQRVDKRNSR